MTELHESKRRTQSALALALLYAGVVGCTGSAGSTNPSGSVTATDSVGTWVQTDGTRTWTLSAGSSGVGQTAVIQAGGPATFAQSNHQKIPGKKNPSRAIGRLLRR